MRAVVALGGNALLRRDEPMTIENQRSNVALACEHLAPVAAAHELVISHGNGPQIGVLALEAEAYRALRAYPLDVLGAETQGMVGYLIEQELRNCLPFETPIATLLTMVEVDPADPAFTHPSKPIGPRYSTDEVAQLRQETQWAFLPDGEKLRRVVPAPAPKRIIQERQIRELLDAGCIVICVGGGGIPCAHGEDGLLHGLEAVIDKDHASGLLARDLHADVFVMATDTPHAYLGFATSATRAITAAHPDALLANHADEFGAGSMLPKVTAACDFARATGKPAVIGQIADIDALVAGLAGTRISTDVDGVVTVAPRSVRRRARE